MRFKPFDKNIFLPHSLSFVRLILIAYDYVHNEHNWGHHFFLLYLLCIWKYNPVRNCTYMIPRRINALFVWLFVFFSLSYRNSGNEIQNGRQIHWEDKSHHSATLYLTITVAICYCFLLQRSRNYIVIYNYQQLF